jgi:dipeptidase D
MYGKDPEVMTIHAGLECGLILTHLPDVDAVSFGPNILDIHTTD